MLIGTTIATNKEFSRAVSRLSAERMEAVFAVLVAHLAPSGERVFRCQDGALLTAEIGGCETLSAVQAHLRAAPRQTPAGPARFAMGAASEVLQGASQAASQADLDLGSLDLALLRSGKRWALSSPSGLYGEQVLTVFSDYAQRLAALHGNKHLKSETLLEGHRRRAALSTFNRTARALPLLDPVARLETLAVEAPGDVALIDRDGALSFAALWADVTRLSAMLQAETEPGEVIAVCLPRGRDSVAAFLAVWHAGLVWLPMPPSVPAPHRAPMLETAGARHVLTCAGQNMEAPVVLRVEDAADKTCARRNVDPESDAAVMFTSGTTGLPNGVRHSHRALANRFGWWLGMHPPQGDDVYMHRTALNFIPSLTEMVSGVLSGRPLVVLDDAAASDPDRIAAAISTHDVTRLAVLPALLRKMLDRPAAPAATGAGGPGPSSATGGQPPLSSLRIVTSAGEPCEAALVARLRDLAPNAILLNDYGCTETNGVLVASSAQMPETAERLPAGRPIPNCMALVLTHAGHIAPVGLEGELCIAGMGVGRGYIGREELNAARFRTLSVPTDLVPGGKLRLFCTRDRARWLPDGQIEVLGRLDNVLKIRGIRIEAEATESVVQAQPGVAEAACGAVQAGNGAKHLGCWIVWTSPEQRLEDAELRAALSRDLPDAAIPTRFFAVAALPRTPNGKLARARLAETEPLPAQDPQKAPRTASQSNTTPQPNTTPASHISEPHLPPDLQTSSQRAGGDLLPAITEALAQVLEVSPAQIDPNRDFKLLGLDSVTVVDFMRDLSDRLGRRLPVGLPFDCVTPRRMAEVLTTPDAAAPAGKSGSHGQGAGDIAVVGMACKMPDAPDVAAFWELLKQGRSAVREIPARRWNWRAHAGDDIDPSRRSTSRWGAFLSGEDKFDPLFFGISAREALVMSPEQRLFLETCWHGLSDAGIAGARAAGQRIGVFAGARSSDYQERILDAGVEPNARTLLGQDNAILAARISYFLDLKGPAITLDTACSSSLVAIHQAARAIRDGDCDMALAGGVSLVTTPTQYIQNSRAGMLSPDGRCATFSAGANGFVQGEGCGVVVLKPLAQAEADGDQIYAVLKASGVNQDGRSNGITAPNGTAQRELIARVHAQSGAPSAAIGLIEAHGTGTKLGDPIEFEALRDVFEASNAPQNGCALGSVKTNIGHLIAAAGIAGFIKSCLALHHRYIPASLNFTAPNEFIDLENSPFAVPVEGRQWQADTPRRAAISAFGFSGTNCHLVLEEGAAAADPQPVATSQDPSQDLGHDPIQDPSQDPQNDPALILLAGASEEALRLQAATLARHLRQTSVALQDVALTLARRLDAQPVVAALWVADCTALAVACEALSKGEAAPEILFQGNRPRDAAPSDLGTFAQDQIAAVQTGTRPADAAWARGLARIFAIGEALDLTPIYTEGGARPCYLPPIPFVQQSYWLEPKDQPPATLTLPGVLCRDHRVQGQCWLPATAQLSAGLTALTATEQGHTQVLRDWQLLSPVATDGNEDITLGLEVVPTATGQRLTWRHGDAVTARALLQTAPETASAPVGLAPEKLRALLEEFEPPLDHAAFYDRCRAAGLDYGPLFRAVRTLYSSGDRAVAFLEAPKPAQEQARDEPVLLQATLLDAALHVAVGLTPEGVLAVPARVDRLTLTSPLPPRLVVLAEVTARSKDHLILRLRLLSETGQGLAEVDGLRLQILTGSAGKTASVQEFASSDRCALGLWTRQISQAQPAVPTPRITRVQELPQHPTPEVTRSSDHLIWRPLAPNAETLIEEFLVYARLLTQTQAPAWLLIDTAAQAAQQPAAAAMLLAASRAVRAERPKLHVRCIGPESGSDMPKEPALQVDAQAFAFEGTTGTEAHRWSALACAAPAAPAKPELETTAIRTDPVCLVTGGLGGVGRKLVEWLVQSQSARIVLASHRSLTRDEHQWIKSLRHGNGPETAREIVAYRTDLGDAEACATLLRKISLRFGPLDRLYHVAGVTADALIANKTPEQISLVMRAKQHTLATLDAALGDRDLEQMVLFSSISAVIGTPGQADYAAANAWLDDFAERRNRCTRRKGQTLSVNWALMADGRMTPPPAELRRLRARHGMAPLPSEIGFDQLDTLLAAKASQAIMAYGDPAKLDAWINADTAQKPEPRQ